MEQKYINDLHLERTVWSNTIKFYRDDLKVMKSRLDEVVSKNNHPDFLKKAEHFQNQFLIQADALDKLKHAIHAEEAKMLDAVKANPTAYDHKKQADDVNHRDAVKSAERIFNDLRHEFIAFLTVYM